MDLASVLLGLRQNEHFVFVTRFFHYFAEPLDLLPREGQPHQRKSSAVYYTPFLLEELLVDETRIDRVAAPYFRLLKTLAGWRAINMDNWVQAGLVREYAKRGLPAPHLPSATVLDWPLALKVEVLRDLCDWHLQAADTLRSLVDIGKEDERELNLQPACSSGKVSYYAMQDGRLYALEKRQWRVLAISAADYQQWFDGGDAPAAVKKKIKHEYAAWIAETLAMQARAKPVAAPFYSLGDKRSSGRVQERVARERSLQAEQERERLARLHVATSDSLAEAEQNDDDGPRLSEREQRRLLRDQKRAVDVAKEAEQREKEEQVEQIARSIGQMPLRLFLRVPATAGNEEVDIINSDGTEDAKQAAVPERLRPVGSEETVNAEEAALLAEFAQETGDTYPPYLADSALPPPSSDKIEPQQRPATEAGPK